MGPQPAPTTSAETKPAQPTEERLVCAVALLRERATENVERLTWSVIEDNVARWLRKNPGKDLKTWWELQRCAVAYRQQYRQPVNYPVPGTPDYFPMATVNALYENWVKR